MRKLTKRTVESLAPSERDEFVWDAELTGFGVRVYPSGRKIYLLQWKRSNRTRRLVIGQHGPVTCDEARARARVLLGEIARGLDPAAERDLRKAELTISGLIARWEAAGCPAVSKHRRGIASLKPSSRAAYLSACRRHIIPLLGSRKLSSLTSADVMRFQRDVAAGKTAVDEKTGKHGRAIVRGGHVVAGRATAYLQSLLSWAVAEGLASSNPALGVQRYDAEPRERFLSPRELVRLGRVLSAAERSLRPRVNSAHLAAIRLLVLTGCRLNEVLGLCWDYLDREAGVLRLPSTKTGRRVVPLTAPAFGVIEALPRVRGNPHIFPSERGAGRVVNLRKTWARITKAALLPGLRLHDLRHSHASVAASNGQSLLIIGALLGHRQVRTSQRYAHLVPDAVRAAAETTAATIAAALDGQYDQLPPLHKPA